MVANQFPITERLPYADDPAARVRSRADFGDGRRSRDAKDPVNKLVHGLRPDLKALYELPTGTSLFPDVFAPRQADRDEAGRRCAGCRCTQVGEGESARRGESYETTTGSGSS